MMRDSPLYDAQSSLPQVCEKTSALTGFGREPTALFSHLRPLAFGSVCASLAGAQRDRWSPWRHRTFRAFRCSFAYLLAFGRGCANGVIYP